jgi:hypothetical protein
MTAVATRSLQAAVCDHEAFDDSAVLGLVRAKMGGKNIQSRLALVTVVTGYDDRVMFQ